MSPRLLVLGLLLPPFLLACGSSSSSGAAPGGGTSETKGAIACTAEPLHTGVATYYTTATGAGNCGFDATPNDLMIGAMNAADYENSGACGACAKITGPNGDITVRIVDQCPDCEAGQIDLSPSAFDGIAARSAGRVPIKWQYVACGETGPIGYYFKEGSNPYWTAVQIRHHLARIAKLEVMKNGAFVTVARESYNYFVDPSGMGNAPYTFRVTDVYGDTVEDSGIALEVQHEVPGKAQLPACK
jgi:expansin (peptidoglycan-binding protein)